VESLREIRNELIFVEGVEQELENKSKKGKIQSKN